MGASAWWRRSRPPGPVQAPLTVTSVSEYRTSSQMRGVASTCGITFSRKAGASSAALATAGSIALCLKPMVPVAMRNSL